MNPERLVSIRGQQHPLQLWLLVGVGLFSARNALATEYYVATNGSNSNPGTLAQPFATIQKGHDVAVAGDTVYMRGGTYKITTPATGAAGISITKSGTSDTNRIKFWAYNDEVPVFDFTGMTISTTGYTSGFAVSGSWLHFKGLEICNVPMNTRSNTGMGVNDASNDIFELMNFHNNNGTGIFFSHGTGGHLVLNCDSHDNYDPTSSQGAGQNADGFGCHYQTSGTSTIFRGCRAWWNSDDGYDLISQEVPVTFENSWAMGNGYINSGTAKPGSGNGNGFKAGSSKTGIRHIIRNCVAWKNAATGFYANHSAGGNTWYNNTSYNNGTQYDMLASSWDAAGNRTDGVILTGSLVHIMRNNIGFPNDNTNMGGVDSKFNTWDLNITPAANDFASVTDTGCMGPRQSDGSPPNLDFMKLRTGSHMIDKGTDVGLPYVGSAPDLGAYEFGASGSSGTGGAGTGGSNATGGTTSTGGSKATGGSAGTGGSTSNLSTGGTKGAGGEVATGGLSNVGGTFANAAGGLASTGATGGTSSSRGTAATTGGTYTSTGSSTASGGSANAGGVTGTGGSNTGAGGVVATTGGVFSTGGVSSTLVAGGSATIVGGAATSGSSTLESTTTTGAGSTDNTGSCSCRTAGTSSSARAWSCLGLLGFLLLRSRRRRDSK